MTMLPMPSGRLSSEAGFGVASDSAEPYGRKWLFSFGAYGCTRVLVVGADPDLEDALEIAAEWLKEHAPGIFSEPDYADACAKHGLEWPLPEYYSEGVYDKAYAYAETDHTYTESGWILSWEWSVSEDPSREQLLSLDGRL